MAALLALLVIPFVLGTGCASQSNARQAKTQPRQEQRASAAQLDAAVVEISTLAFGIPVGVGAGVFVSGDGHIMTNYHVTEPALIGPFNLVIRTVDGKVFSGDQIRVHGCGDRRRLDLCLLRVDHKPTQHFRLTGKEKRDATIRRGDRIRVLGHPKGLAYTLSEGIIAGFRRLESSGEVLDDRDPSGFDAVQITAPISPGNSGGPVFTEDGQLVGLSTFIYAPDDSQNLNMAIRTNEIASFFRRTVREAPMALGPYFERAQDLGHQRFDTRIEKELAPVYRFIKAGQELPQAQPFFRYQSIQTTRGSIRIPTPTFARCGREDRGYAVGVACETDDGDQFSVLLNRGQLEDIRTLSGRSTEPVLVEELQRLPGAEIDRLERTLSPNDIFMMRSRVGRYHCVDRIVDEERDYRGDLKAWRACVQTVDNSPSVGGTSYSLTAQDPASQLVIEGQAQTQYALSYQWITWVVDIMVKGSRVEPSAQPVRAAPLIRQPAGVQRRPKSQRP